MYVSVATGCSNTFTNIYSKRTDDVAISAGGQSPTYSNPISADCKTPPNIDLSAYNGMVGVRIQFRVVDYTGNNFFLDNINVSNTPLPLTLLNFEGTFEGTDAAQLIWKVTSETEVQGYKLLRTTNISPNEWKEIAFVPSLNSGNSIQNYSYYDIDLPFASTIYYKLVSVENDGRVSECKIITLSREEPIFPILAYPNPTDNSFTVEIEGGRKSSYTLQLTDVLGQIVEEVTMTTKTISIGENLPSGIYFLQIKYTTDRSIIKLIKK
jgi:hypothetical protein